MNYYNIYYYASGGLANTLASAYTLIGPSGGFFNFESSNFIITPNGIYNGRITIAATSGFGISPNPIIRTWDNSSFLQTFTITPTSTGLISLIPNSLPQLGIDPTTLIYNCIAPNVATSYTMTGPSSGIVNSQSSIFTLTPNGPSSAVVTVTPIVDGGGSPITITFDGTSTAKTFTITPTVAGAISIFSINNSGLSDPPSLTYVAGTPQTITPSWLSSNASVFGGPPYILGQAFGSYAASTYYSLGTDITTSGSALMLTQPNISLDFNGHTITYNNAPRPTITNSLFATDSIGTTANPGPGITGWTVTGPLQATIADISTTFLMYPYGVYLYGHQCVQFTVPQALNGTVTNSSFPSTATISCTNHGLSTNDYIFLSGFSTNPDITINIHQITRIDANTFSLNGVTLSSVSSSAGAFSNATILTSDSIAVSSLYTGRCVTASIESCSDSRTNYPHSIKIEIWQDGSLLPDLTSNGVNGPGGYRSNIYVQNIRSFTATTVVNLASTTPITIKCYIGNPDSVDGSRLVSIARALVTPSHDVGIISSYRGISEVVYSNSLPDAITTLYNGGTNRPNSFVIEDTPTGPTSPRGSIIQGIGGGHFCMAICADRCQGSKVLRDIAISASGDNHVATQINSIASWDSTPIRVGGDYGRGITISYADGLSIGNRFGVNPAVMTDFIAGFCDISYNTFYHCLGNAIIGDIASSQLESFFVHDNTISLQSCVSNQYAIVEQANAKIYNNTIDSITDQFGSGRGIIIAANANKIAKNIEVYGNTVRITEMGDREAGSFNPIRALRVRVTDNNCSLININVHDNEFTAITSQHSAYPVAGAMIDVPIGGRECTITSSIGQPATISVPGYTFTNGEIVHLNGFDDTPDINGYQTVTSPTGNSFTISTVLTRINNTVVNNRAAGLVKHGTDMAIIATVGNQTYRNNLFRGISTYANNFASAIEFGEIDSDLGPSLIFDNNTCDSNDTSIALDTLGAYGPIDNPLCTSTIFSKNTTWPGVASVTYYNLIADGSGPLYPDAARFVSNTYINGATNNMQFNNYSNKIIGTGWRATVSVADGTGLAISGAYVKITNNILTIDSSGTTNAFGIVADMPIITTVYSGISSIATTNYTHTLTVSKAPYITQDISLGSVGSDLFPYVTLST